MRWGTLLLCAPLLGCATTREVTPWLRVVKEPDVPHIAESGGSSHLNGEMRIERLVAGEWVVVPGATRAFGFSGGRRAVVDDRLYAESGLIARLDCEGELRALPSGRELHCFERLGEVLVGEERYESLRIRTFDHDAKPRAELHTRAPVPGSRQPFMVETTTEFLGFGPKGWVFSVFTARKEDSFASKAPQSCAAYGLATDGTWQSLGRIQFSTAEMWKCHDTRVYHRELGLTLEPGVGG